MSGSARPDTGYSLLVIRPAHLQARPLSGLSELLGTGHTDIPNGAVPLCGVTLDSREVQPGDLYAALPGGRAHGADFCGDAVARGAVAVLTDPAGRDRAARHGVPVFVVSLLANFSPPTRISTPPTSPVTCPATRSPASAR